MGTLTSQGCGVRSAKQEAQTPASLPRRPKMVEAGAWGERWGSSQSGVGCVGTAWAHAGRNRPNETETARHPDSQEAAPSLDELDSGEKDRNHLT